MNTLLDMGHGTSQSKWF